MSAPQVTHLLDRIRGGDEGAKRELYERVYGELKRIAQSIVSRERGNATQATAIVHEMYQRLDGAGCGGSKHFYSTAAKAMRHLLVDMARGNLAAKRGAGLARVSLEGVDVPVAADPENLLALDESLALLKGRADDEPDAGRRATLARQHEVVMLRFFAGLQWEEIGSQLDISDRQAKRDWAEAKEFLRQCLSAGEGPGEAPGAAATAAPPASAARVQ